MEIRRFRVKVLTPVHIGAGRSMAPEEYFLRDSRLVRFRPEAVMRAWSPREREAFENRLRAGALGPAWEQLRTAAMGRRESWLYEIAAGEGSQRELGGAPDPSRRWGEVFLLLWNLARREVIVPGSAIKGALRTALVNGCVQADLAAVRPEVDRRKRQVRDWRRSNDVWRAMEAQALGLASRGGGGPDPIDPLQMLKVADTAVRADLVRVDQAEVRKQEGAAANQRIQIHCEARDEGSNGGDRRAAANQRIQIHCERLLSAADGQPAEFPLEIRWDRDRALDRRVRAHLGRQFDWSSLVRAANAYFYGRLEAERERFGFLGRGAARWLPPGEWRTGGRVLLRVGRFSHFESLSIDGIRDGYNAQRRASIQEGDSRTVVVIDNKPVSFGWILLEPEA